MALADAAGLDGLSMRTLGERLGVSAMSLYRYVPGKPELLDLIVELAYAELPQRVPTGHWQDRLAQVARDSWELYLRHPWMLEVSTYRASLGPHSLRKYERELSAAADAGLDDLEMDLVVAAVSDYVRGAAHSLLAARSASQATGQTNAEWWDAHSALLADLVAPKVFPLAVRVGAAAGAAYGGTTDPERAFEFGLRCLIRGLHSHPRHTGRRTPKHGRQGRTPHRMDTRHP
jgi:AcrR family transcriptional regulator